MRSTIHVVLLDINGTAVKRHWCKSKAKLQKRLEQLIHTHQGKIRVEFPDRPAITI